MKRDTVVFGPTLFEKTLSLSHLSFMLGTVIIAVFVGPLGNFLYLYSVSYNVRGALYSTFISANAEELGFVQAIQSHWYSLVGNILWYAFLFYVAFLTIYLRTRLIKAEPDLVALAPNEEKDVQRVFRTVSAYVPQLIMIFIFLFVYATSVPELISKGELTALSTPIFILRSLFRSLMFGSVLWLYSSSLWGLYCFGKQNLKLKSYHEDPMLGTKRLGSLSFSFSLAYLFGMILFDAQAILGGLTGQTSVVNIIFMLVLVPIGIVLFLAPLVSAHKRILEAKRVEITSINKQLSKLAGQIRESSEKNDQNMLRLLTLETTERRITSIKTWPIENPLIGKLTVITASVAAILIARLIQILLHI